MVRTNLKLLILLFFIWPSVMLAKETSDAQTYNDAIKLFQGGDSERAIDALQMIYPGSSYFKNSLETLGKIYYKKNQLDELFALTTFYRRKYENDDHNDISLLALEILALGKLCQFEHAESLLSDLSLRYGVNRGSEVDKIEKSYQLVKSYALKTDFKPKDYKGKYVWEFDRSKILNLKDPHKLRIKVENKCQ